MDIEKELKILFDYQMFENNTRVGNIIEESSVKEMMVSDDDLSMVNAAGDPYINHKNESD